MIIIAGHTLNDPDKRDAAIAGFADLIARARKFDGCLDFAISADSVDPARANLFECWRDQKALNAWRKIAKGPRGKPRAVDVKLYRTEKAEKPF
jgi:quinol monooxygenase YgiN